MGKTGDRDRDFQLLPSTEWMIESVVNGFDMLDGASSYTCSEHSREMSKPHAVPLTESVLL